MFSNSIFFRVFFRGMCFVMTLKKTLPPKGPEVFKFHSLCFGIGKYDSSVKINEITVVSGIALAETDTVGIVACRTWCFLFYMFFMFWEAFII